MEEKSLYEFETEPEQRPSFLTWLCILTFIGSGWAIISCVWTYSMAGKTNLIFQKSVHVKNDSTLRNDTANVRREEKATPLERKIKASFSKIVNTDNMRKAAIGGFIASLLTLAGAILMWNLKRKGFYIYILGVVFGILIPFYLYGNDMIAIGATSFASFFGLLFIALYALNLKSMHTGRRHS
jgi:ABC-type Fe3+-siderophore transport system permease subunit